MKKVSVTVQYDEEKLNALKIYLKQKDMNLDVELAKSLDALFNKNVPSGVREFISMKSESYTAVSTLNKSEKSI